MKNLKNESVADDDILLIDNEINALISEDRAFEDLKKDSPHEVGKQEEALHFHISEDDLTLLKAELLDKWIYLSKKLSYPFDNFKSLDDYQKPIVKIEKVDFLRKIKNACPIDEEIGRSKGSDKVFDMNIKRIINEIMFLK